MSSIPVFIPFVNRTDLLAKAVASVPRRQVTNPIALNNSGEVHSVPCVTYTPSVPLTASQTLNWMQSLAVKMDVPFYFFMHNDAEAGPETVDQLYRMAFQKTHRGERWGVIFTLYDTLAAFNTRAFAEVGPWDTNLPQYFTDNDMYRRMRLAGWELAESNLPMKHEGSQTIHSDTVRKLANNISFPIYRQYYIEKWGGEPGKETFETPFNGRFNGQAKA